MNKIFRVLPFCLSAVIAGSLAWTNFASAIQDKSTVDEIRDYKDQIFIVKSLDQFNEHAAALAVDLEFIAFREAAEKIFEYRSEGEYDVKRPIVFHSKNVFPSDLIQLPVKSMEKVKKRAGEKDITKIFQTRSVGFDGDFFNIMPSFALVQDSRLAFGKSQISVEGYAAAPPLAKSLDDRFKKLINESGITFFSKVTDDYHPDLALSYASEDQFTPEEMETLKLVDQVIESAKHTAIGFTYDKKCIALSGLVAFNDHDAAEKIFDFDATDESFKPTIGLPRKDLISTVSMQVDALRSPETARLIPKFLGEGGSFGLGSSWLEGKSIGIAMQLLADTWHDVKGVRAGLYLADGKTQGNICIVGVVDPRNPDSIIDELSKLVTLVDRKDDKHSKEDRAAEIANLIKQLDSNDYNVRQRASTRLVLSGPDAEAPLKVAANSDNAERRARANQVLKKLDVQTEQAMKKFRVSTTEFWANLRPQFSMEKQQVKYGSHDCYMLRIHPDPSKSENDVRMATDIMIRIFGESWDKLPMVRVGERYAFMFGSNMELFDEVVANLKADKDPIGSSDVIRKQRIVPGQFQMQVSMARVLNVYFDDQLGDLLDVKDNNLTTVTVSLDRETWGVNLHMPIEEVKVFIDYSMGSLR